jgi:hypothetical protein
LSTRLCPKNKSIAPFPSAYAHLRMRKIEHLGWPRGMSKASDKIEYL